MVGPVELDRAVGDASQGQFMAELPLWVGMDDNQAYGPASGDESAATVFGDVGLIKNG